mgnify:FL=1
MISEIAGVGPASKTVMRLYTEMISKIGNEFDILTRISEEEIGNKAGHIMKEAVHRMRSGRVRPQSGYDGAFGVIRVFEEGELDTLSGQGTLFGDTISPAARRKKKKRSRPL